MPESTTALSLEDLLAHAIKIAASDIHITEGQHLGFRVHGELGKLTQAPVADSQVIKGLVHELFHGDLAKIENFMTNRDVDFAYVSKDGTPFRVNGFFKLGKIGFVMRRIEREAKKMEDLGLPPGVNKLLSAKQGLFLIT